MTVTVVSSSRSRVLTIPNAISLGRLACVPWFLVLLLGDDRPVAAGVLLAVLGATDWVDGYIARHFDQASEVGKVLDPTADRILLIAAGVAILVEGSLPTWVGIVILTREALITIAVVVLAAAGAKRIDVQWAGKAGTLALMFALPGFVFVAHSSGATHDSLQLATWLFTVGGLACSWYATVQYVPLAKTALRDGRAARSHEELP